MMINQTFNTATKGYSVPTNSNKNLLRSKYDEISVCQTSGTATKELFSPQKRRQKFDKTMYITAIFHCVCNNFQF